MASLPWPTLVFLIQSLVSLPVYLCVFVFVCLQRRRGKFYNVFYHILISMGIGDVLAMVNFFLFSSLRTIHAFPEFYWEHRNSYIVPVWGFNQMYYFLCLRSFGAVLLAIQRYLCICRPVSKFSTYFDHLKLYQIFLIHWIPPLLIASPILINSEKTFDSLESLQLRVAPAQIKLANVIANAFLFTTFVVLCSAYMAVLRTVIKTKISRNQKRELRLTLVTVGPLISFLCAFCYYTAQMLFSVTENTSMIYTMRIYFPILTGFMSYVNGWVFFLFNADVKKELLKNFRRNPTVNTISDTT